MFHKSRRKIVASIMGTLLLLFTVTLSVIVLSEYYESRQQSREMLDHFVELYSLNRLPEDEPNLPPPFEELGHPDDELVFHLSTFYSVAISDQNEIIAIDTGRTGLYSESRLTDIANDILASGKKSGTYGALQYRVDHRSGYTLVAFMDNTVARQGLVSLTRHTLIVGGVALVILFFIAILLSRRIIKPLEENDRRQKQFISDAGHELKTPISVISTNIELLSRQIDANEWLDNIRYENERMGELVIQLLDLSRAENAEVLKEQIDLSRLITREALPFESVAFENGLTLQTDIAENIEILGNSSQLSQLISILLDNAIRHTDGGNEIRLSLTRQGHHAVITVENDGKEIPGETLSRLFERFYRLDDVRNSESKHYGLGLAIAKAIAEGHGGNISASCYDRKVAFSVSLPLKNF